MTYAPMSLNTIENNKSLEKTFLGLIGFQCPKFVPRDLRTFRPPHAGAVGHLWDTSAMDAGGMLDTQTQKRPALARRKSSEG